MRQRYVFDTNVILYDPQSIYAYKNSDIIIPITVLEEIDKFKKGHDETNRNARVFDRLLDEITEDKQHIKDIALGDGIRLTVSVSYLDGELPLTLDKTKNDNLILLCASVEKNSILISKDINLRMKAKAFSIPTQDYNIDNVPDVDDLYAGFRVVEGLESDVIDALYEGPIDPEDASIPFPVNNEYYSLKNGKQSAIARYDGHSIVAINSSIQASNIKPRNLEQIFALDALLDPDIQIVALTGKAGTGKTLLAIATAISKKKDFRQIFLSRPVMPLGKDIGFLPGDINEKMDPYMQPLWDNIATIKEASAKPEFIEKLIDDKKIVVEPLTFIRGRSLPKIFFIIDEAQNLTPHEIKTIVTRAGVGTKVVFTGDINQIDSPYLDSESNGLSYLIHKFKGQKLFAHVKLTKGERSELAELASDIL